MNFDDIMNAYRSNRERFDELKELCDKDLIIPFVGAGMSMPTYPSWRNALINILERENPKEIPELEELLNNGKYEDAAEFVINSLGRGMFESEFEKEFSVEKIDKKRLPESVQILPEFFTGTVLTTNYDKCLEKSYEKEIRDALARAIRNNAPYLFKIHGDIDNFSQRVLTEEEYNEVYGEESEFVKLLSQYLSSKVLLFLGCSLSGSDRYWKILGDLGKDRTMKNYAFLRLPELKDEEDKTNFKEWKRILSNLWIFPIWYPAEDEKHESVKILLEALKDGRASDKSECITTNPYYADRDTVICRNDEIDKLKTMLKDNKPLLLVSGLGGIGKTYLARLLFNEIKSQYQLVGWFGYSENLIDSILRDSNLFPEINNYE